MMWSFAGEDSGGEHLYHSNRPPDPTSRLADYMSLQRTITMLYPRRRPAKSSMARRSCYLSTLLALS